MCPRCGETHDVTSYCGDLDDFYDSMLTEVTDVGDDFIEFIDSADDDDSNTSY